MLSKFETSSVFSWKIFWTTWERKKWEILNNKKKQPGILQQTYGIYNFGVLSALYIFLSQIWSYLKIGVP